MIPPIYQLLIADSAVYAIVGTRIYYKPAKQGGTQPYIVLTFASSVPNNNLSELPDNDDQRIQIDTYALGQILAEQLGETVRDAIEAEYDILIGPTPIAEVDTDLSRWSMDVQVLNNRWQPASPEIGG